MNFLLVLSFLPLIQTAHAAAITYTASTAPEVMEAYAIANGIYAPDFINTLKCESDFDPRAVGDDGSSWGIAQIHLPAHPDISKQEALDPLWSIAWAAAQFAAGNADLWSCYRNTQAATGP